LIGKVSVVAAGAASVSVDMRAPWLG
jgi:hypothetical protein